MDNRRTCPQCGCPESKARKAELDAVEAKLVTANQTIEAHVSAMRDFKLMREKVAEVAELPTFKMERPYPSGGGVRWKLSSDSIGQLWMRADQVKSIIEDK